MERIDRIKNLQDNMIGKTISYITLYNFGKSVLIQFKDNTSTWLEVKSELNDCIRGIHFDSERDEKIIKDYDRMTTDNEHYEK